MKSDKPMTLCINIHKAYTARILKCTPPVLYLRPTLYLHGTNFITEPAHGLQGGIVITDFPLASNKVLFLKDGNLRLLMILQSRKLKFSTRVTVIPEFLNCHYFLRLKLIFWFIKKKSAWLVTKDLGNTGIIRKTCLIQFQYVQITDKIFGNNDRPPMKRI
jgi:hypothetical protein